MLRVLLASDDQLLVEKVRDELGRECMVETCGDGNGALELLRIFDPEVMMIDTRLSGLDAFTVIRTARASFRRLGILVVTSQRNSYTENQLAALNVNYVLIKPCKLSAVVSQIMSIGCYVSKPCGDHKCVENEVNSMLLDLSFRMGPGQYYAIKQAVLARYYSAEGVLMKDIYYRVAKICGGTSPQKEKAIRDGIRVAAKRGELHVWQMYFLPGRDGQWRCPTNEEFVARLADCLRQNGRRKLPYERKEEKAV